MVFVWLLSWVRPIQSSIEGKEVDCVALVVTVALLDLVEPYIQPNVLP